jgi:hypothetical protein
LGIAEQRPLPNVALLVGDKGRSEIDGLRPGVEGEQPENHALGWSVEQDMELFDW